MNLRPEFWLFFHMLMGVAADDSIVICVSSSGAARKTRWHHGKAMLCFNCAVSQCVEAVILKRALPGLPTEHMTFVATGNAQQVT
jgi:hypothetical protein